MRNDLTDMFLVGADEQVPNYRLACLTLVLVLVLIAFNYLVLPELLTQYSI